MVAREHAGLVRRLRLAALAGVSVTALNCAAAAQDGGERPLSLPADGRISIVPVAADRISLPLDADAARFTVSIPPGPLEPALTALAKQMQIRLAYQTTLTEGLVTQGADGEFQPLEALAKILEGTGLTYRAAGPSTITLVNPRYVQLGSPTVQPNSILLDEISVSGERQAAATEAGLPPLTGTIGQPPVPFVGGQVASGARVGFLGNKSVFDTPFTQNSYTEQLVRDQQAVTVADVLANDAAVRTTTAPFGVGDNFTIRGFSIGENGFAFDGLYGLASVRRPALEGVERVEVLRGPSALLFGFPPTGSVAGVINLVPKRAAELPLTRVTGEFFSNGNGGGAFDIARRFGDGSAFGMRLNGAYRDGNTPIDNQSVRNAVFTAGLDFRSDRFRASADFGYQNFETRAPSISFGVLPGFVVPRAPDLTRNIQQPWSFFKTEHVFGLARAEYDVLPNWTLFGGVGASRFSERFFYSNPTIINSAGDVSINNFAFPVTYDSVTAEAGIRGIVETGPFTHALTLVGNIYKQRSAITFEFLPSSEITNIYTLSQLSKPDFGNVFTRTKDPTDTMLAGVTIGDTVSVFDDRLQLIVGGRFQRAETASYLASGEQLSNYNKTAATPLVGLVVKPWQPLSLYVSYAEGFGFGPSAPTGAINANQVFPPVISTQVETGAKVNFGTLGATLAFFEIKQPNGILNPVTNVFGLNGEQRNRGVDFNVFGQPLENVRVLGGISIIDGVLSKTEGGLFNGNIVPGVANFNLNLGGEVDLPSWFLPGLTLSGRVIHTSAQFVDQANTQRIPNWTRLDLGIRYRFVVNETPLVARFNVENVTGTNYWASSFNGSLAIGNPQTFRLSLSADL